MLRQLRQQRARDCVFGGRAIELEQLYGALVRGGDGGCCYQRRRMCSDGVEGGVCAAEKEEAAEGRGCVHFVAEMCGVEFVVFCFVGEEVLWGELWGA